MSDEIQENVTPTMEETTNEVAVTATTKNKGTAEGRGNRAQKVGVVSSDKMQKTVVVRVDRMVKHQKYRRYVRRTTKFMAHDETGASIGDKVRIVETRPLSARKRWRVVEIIQKAAK
jgi:small subunit ribosomal protein S17